MSAFDLPSGRAAFDVGQPAAAAAAASLLAVSAEEIDLTDGSWTLYDPDSLIDSVSRSDGWNVVTWNALAAGSSDYTWSSGTTHRAPRWSKLLKIDGSQIDNQNHLILSTRLELDGTVNDFDQQVVCGAALDPSSTANADIDGTGGLVNKTTAGNPAYGTWQRNAATSTGNASNAYGIATVLRAGDSLGGGGYVNFDSSDGALASGTRSSNVNAAAGSTVDVYIMVGVGTAAGNDVVTAGDQQKFKAHYTPMTLEIL